MMSKAGKSTSAAQEWVEVAQEPNHKAMFENGQIRVYVAVIPPGRETDYHRHDKDTLYVVLQGGKNTSRTLPGSKSTKYVFPKSVGLMRKIKWVLTRLIYGWVDLPESIYFLMHNEGNPVIHKVRASEDNPRDMRLMGIEFLDPGGRHRSASIGTRSLRVDYEDSSVSVLPVKFPADLPHMEESVCFMGMVIVLKGTVRIEASSPGEGEPVPHDLNEGNLIWNDGSTPFTFTVPEGSEAEALVILMK
jgi:hypothetical protein